MKWLALIFAGLLCGIAVNGMRTVELEQNHTKLSAQIHELKKERNQLNSDWAQLLIEQKALVNDHMIEQALANGLNLHVPQAKQVVYLK